MKTFNRFQHVLKNVIRNINSSKDIIVAADKTRNMYKMSHEKYDKLVSNSITQSYRKAEDNISYTVATECKNLSRKLNIENHMPSTKLNPAFITIKDHKENFNNNAKCRLINPIKPESGKVSNNIVDKMNVSTRRKADVNQWRSTKEVIRWFNNLEDKKQLSYLTFDIVDFYPSITDNPLIKTLKWAQKYHNIAVTEFDAIMHAGRTILCDHRGNVWTKKNSKNQFDVSMGANYGAEICEIVGLYILSEIQKKHRFHKRRIIPRRWTSSDTICIWKLLG